MIRHQQDGYAKAIAWLLIWVLVIAVIVLLTADLTIGDQRLLDRQRDGAGLCVTYYSENGATGSRYVKCR